MSSKRNVKKELDDLCEENAKLKWNQLTGLQLARKCEQHARKNGLHVGLTGGVLYKDGDRKDLDIVVYTHNDNDKFSEGTLGVHKEAFLEALMKHEGFGQMQDFGRVVKTTHSGRVVDLIFPQCDGEYESYTYTHKDFNDEPVPF